MKNKLWAKGIVIGIIVLFFGASVVPFIKADPIAWDVTLYFTNPGGQNDYVMFGEAPDACDGPPADSYDVVKPPAPMVPYIRAYLKDNLPIPYTNLWKDYRYYPDSAKVWNLSVKWEPEDGESPTTITMSWSTAEVDDSEYTTVSLCTDAGVILQNMLVNNTYMFSCPASVLQNFKIIASGNQPPVANPDSYSTNEDTLLTVTAPGVLGNDTDLDGDLLTGVKVRDPVHGTLVLNANGGFTYIPATNYNGPDSFTYRAFDGTVNSNNATVSITVTAVNDSPVVTDIPDQTIAEGSTFATISLDNYVSDPDNTDAEMTWTYSGNSQLSVSIVARVATITIPNLDWNGTETITFTATDPGSLWDDDPVTFTVTVVNDPLVFGTPSPGNGSTRNLLSFSWSIPISDPEGDSFNWVIQCSNGQSANANGASNGTKSLSLSGLAYLTTYKVWVNATDPTGSGLYTRKWYGFTTAEEPNSPPAIPQRPSGTASGKINVEYTYTTITTDPNHDQIYYNWSWGDGTTSGWLGPYPSNQTVQAKHTWTKKGNYGIKIKAKDIHGAESNWSESLPITMPVSQHYILSEIGALIHFIIRFFRGEFAGMTFIQILRIEGWFL